MATFFTLPVKFRAQPLKERPLRARQARPQLDDLRFGIPLVSLLTALALAVHGYHPYAEDGGLYMAGVKHLLNPALYPHWSEFVTEHLRFSLFAPLVAGLVRASHLRLMTVWLVLYILSIWMMLFAAWMLAVRCYPSREARCGAVALIAVWLTIPIAGTSLMLMDPYLSARSISTPCALFALIGVLDLFHPQAGNHFSRIRGLALCLAALTLAILVHPLMAAYALGCALLLACLVARSPQIRIGGTVSLAVLAVLVATVLYTTAPRASEAYRLVALTRGYWFLGSWQWYEQFGLVAPLLILAFFGWRTDPSTGVAARGLHRTAVVAGSLGLLVALAFVHIGSSNYLVARLQPLRIFQLVYVAMIVALGSVMGAALGPVWSSVRGSVRGSVLSSAWGERLLQRQVLRWGLTFAGLASILCYAAHRTFPNSDHLELPWVEPRNQWQRAFLWIEKNTPADALFALDAHYISAAGEDAQTFRAIAERSALPDFSKDGGEASITPNLTDAWTIGQAAQTNLNSASDADRVTKLLPLGVTWVVLPASARTMLTCDYDTQGVKVCRLPRP